MGARQTAWHVLFGWLLEERAAPGIEIRPEVPLGSQPQRSDFLLLRRTAREFPRSADAQVLRGLWPRISREALMEFKSVSRSFEDRDLERLLGYGLQWWTGRRDELPTHSDLTLVLVVASLTPTLHRAASALGWRWRDLGDGYRTLIGGPFELIVVELDTVARSEHDELLGAFGHAPVTTAVARRWLKMHKTNSEGAMRLDELEDFDDVLRKFVTTLAPEERLAGLAPEERLAGLAPDEFVLALPDEVIRALSPEFIERLSPEVRDRIRARIAR